MINGLFDNFVPLNIRLPGEAQARRAAVKNCLVSGLPPLAYASIDGVHIKVKPPKADKLIYICRHGYASLNAMMLCAPDTYIHYVKSDCPGSFHDSRVFKESNLYKLFDEDNWVPFPDAFICADAAYETFKVRCK